MSLSPFFRSPFTDITGGMISHQLLGRCQREEAHYMDCLEAYGFDRGLRKCHHLLADFKECQTTILQFKRFVLLGRCAEQEMAMMDCIEAYGLDRGARRCQCLIRDFDECQKLTLQFKRFVALRKERERQIASGQLTGDKKFVSPRIDAY